MGAIEDNSLPMMDNMPRDLGMFSTGFNTKGTDFVNIQLELSKILTGVQHNLRGEKKIKTKEGETWVVDTNAFSLNEKGVSFVMQTLNSLFNPNTPLSYLDIPRINSMCMHLGTIIGNELILNSETYGAKTEDDLYKIYTIIFSVIVYPIELCLRRAINGGTAKLLNEQNITNRNIIEEGQAQQKRKW